MRISDWSSDVCSSDLRHGVEGPIKTPADLQGLKVRVPGSKILQQYYRLAGANPTPVAWGETPTAIKQGVADALDPAVEALYAFGFKDILSWVTFNAPVPDSQVYACNTQWLQGLPGDRSEEHTSELQSLMRISYAVFCLKKKITTTIDKTPITHAQRENRHTS